MVYLLFIIINRDRIFEHHDEFSHWGLIVKNMFMKNGYGTVENSRVTFNEYPPFTACFQYILLNLKGTYKESLVIIAQNILYLSIIIPICAKIDFKKNRKNLMVIILTITLLPLILYENFFVEILVDGFLGILFAVGLYTIYKKEENNIYKNIILTLTITALVLTKTTGILLAILILIFYIMQGGTNKKKRFKEILIISILPIILISAWHIKVNTNHSQKEWNFENVLQIKEQAKNNNEIVKKFFLAIFEHNGAIGEKLSMLSLILVLIVYSVYIYNKLKTDDEKKSYIYILMATINSIMIFAIGLLVMYLTIFPIEEARLVSSYDRYMYTVMLTWLMLNTIILCTEIDINSRMLYIFIILMIASMPLKTIYMKYIQNEQYINYLYKERNSYCSGLKKYESIFSKDDKIYFISDAATNNNKVLRMCAYEMMDINIANKKAWIDEDKKEIIQKIIDEKYTYIHIYEIREIVKDNYQGIIEESQIKENKLYKIHVIDSENIELEEIQM